MIKKTASACRAQYSRQAEKPQPYTLSKTAAASISHNTPFGSAFTATQLLAGLDTKYFAYTSLNAAPAHNQLLRPAG